jgi:hypothetical protein
VALRHPPLGYKIEVESGGINFSCRGWTEEEGYGFDYSEDQVTAKSCKRYREDYYDWKINFTTDHFKELRKSWCSGDCPERPTDSEVRVLTYNLYQQNRDYCRNQALCRGRDRMQKERLAEFIETVIEDYDVLILNEIWMGADSGRKAYLIDEAAKRGFKYRVMPEHPSSFKYMTNFEDAQDDGGLLILSRFKIVDAGEMSFYKSENDRLNKGALFAKIELKPNHYMYAFSAHVMHSSSSRNSDYEVAKLHASLSIAVRHNNIMQVREFVEMKTEDAGSNDIIVVGGDWNVDWNVDCTPGNTKTKSQAQYWITDEPWIYEKY